jgi:hypothetical protein
VSPEAWSALVAEGAWLALARPRRGLPAGAGGFAARGPADNVGLVGFEVSGAPPVALVTVRNAGERASRGAVRVGAPGGPFRERALEVGPRATVSIEEPLPGPLPAIEARLAPGDGFAADDAAWAVRRPRKPRAALVGDDLPYVAAALEVAGFEVVRGAAAGATLVVATGIAPAADGNPARTLLVEPPAAAVGLEGGAPFAPGEPRAVGGGPDLTGVAVLHAVGYRAAPGWETLAEAGGRPLILRSGPRTVLAFRPEDAVTNWVRRPSFPAFVAALAAEAAAAAGAGAEWSFHRTGDTVPIAAPPGSMVVVTDPGGAQLGLPSGPDGRALWVPERVGLHVVRAGGREEWTAVNLLSAAASDLADGVEPAAAPLRARPGPARRQDRAPLLLALALLLGTLLWLAERP